MGLTSLIPYPKLGPSQKIFAQLAGTESCQTIPYQLMEIKTFSRLNPYFFMSFPSRIPSCIYASHSRVIGHSVYRQHVSCGPCVNRMGVGISAEVIEAGNHRILKPLVYYVLSPEISHPVLDPLKVRNRDASGVCENVRYHKDSLFMQYLIRGGGCRSICSFGQYLTFDPIRILRSNLVFLLLRLLRYVWRASNRCP